MLGGIEMLLILFAILLFSAFIFLIIYYQLTKSKSLCVYDLAVNKQIPNKMQAIRKIIQNYIQDDLFIIILQDDIQFLDEKYYWPTRTAYIHLSDVDIFLKKYSSDKNNYSYEEIICFVKTKVKIH